MKITEEVYKLEADGNAYLILKPIPFLIDTGNFSNAQKIKEEISKLVPVESISLVIFTHLHYDHCENVGMFPNAEIYASAEEIFDFKKNPEYFFFDRAPYGVKKILNEKLRPLPEEILGLKVLKTPGHTRGSVAFLDENRKLLFSGDTLFKNGIGRTDLPNSSSHDMWDSIQKLSKLINESKLTLCPGHDY